MQEGEVEERSSDALKAAFAVEGETSGVPNVLETSIPQETAGKDHNDSPWIPLDPSIGLYNPAAYIPLQSPPMRSRADILYEVRYFSNNHEEEPYTRALPKPIEEYEKPLSSSEEPSVMRVIYNRGTVFENKDKIAAAAIATGPSSVSPMERSTSVKPSACQELRRPTKYASADQLVLPPSNKRNMTLIEILSPAVQEVIRNSLDYYPDLPDVHQPLKLCWPWPVLGHCDEGLKDYQSDFEKRQCYDMNCAGRYLHRHIGIVRDYFRETHGEALAQELERHTRGMATFGLLWYLLRPGEDVLYDRHDINEYEPYVIRNVEWVAAEGTIVSYSITLWHMDSNSYDMGPAMCTTDMPKYAGEKPITSLRIFPFRFLEKDKQGRSQDESRREMEKRGELFFKLRRKGCWDFRGWSMTFPRRPVSPVCFQHHFHNHYHFKLNSGISNKVFCIITSFS